MSGYTSLVDATIDFVVGTFDAQDVRLGAMGNCLPGLRARGDFTVSQRAAGANMSVDISSGAAFVEPGGPASMQGLYLARTEATYNTASDGGYSWTAADLALSRIDLLCIEAADVDEGGSFTGFKFRVIDGVPNGSATHPLLTTYWPSVPNYCVPIAAICLAPAASSITTSAIVNLNAIGGSSRASYLSKNTTAETTTSTTYARLATPDFVCVYVPHANARIRVFSEGWWKISVASGTQGIALFLNDTQLKLRNTTNAAPAAIERTITSLGTFMSRFITNVSPSNVASNMYSTTAGATADVSDVTTGVIGDTNGTSGAIEISQLAAGWYVIEQRYKTSANTLTVDERRLWAEVVA